MAGPSRFVYIIDRYLEVSNVYHQRMAAGSTIESEASQMAGRIGRLLDLVEGVSPKKPATPLKKIPDGCGMGQVVAPTAEFLEDTKRYQEDVLRRLDNRSIVSMPRNVYHLRSVLELEACEFLGSFPTPTYAWDVLTELASLSVCPDANTLAARDMIHMHAVELQLHLVRVIAQVWSISLKSEVPVEGTFSVEQLRRLAAEGTLVDKLIESAVPRDPIRLLAELDPLVVKPSDAYRWLEENQQLVLSLLQQEIHAFPDTLRESETIDSARELCNTMVIYGLVAAYAAWFTCALEKREEMGSFRTSILFCTRILLDESRWNVCREFARVALDAVRDLNKIYSDNSALKGTGMIAANLFFARRMCGERLAAMKDEILSWNMDGMHQKYHFLKAILLEDFDEAGALALKLLQTNEETGRPSMCIHEFREWPILDAFRQSPQGKKVLNAAE